VGSRNAGASHDAPVFFQPGLIRWGLCCQFLDSPIKFRTATHRYCSTLTNAARAQYLSAIALANATALADAIERCASLGIGAFRITSGMMPLVTHPASGYSIESLPDALSILSELERARVLSRQLDIRLSFHPDQFVVLNSESEAVVTSALKEMEHHALIANLIGAEALTLHAGGGVGGVEKALARLDKGVDRLSAAARGLLALENDDRTYGPAQLLPFCEAREIAFVYDVHHHRCNPDEMSVGEASERAAATWNGREPWMHLSSPRDGWSSSNPRSHAEYIDAPDLPEEWMDKRMTIDVEAKAKERAVLAIMETVRSARKT
jgi:UV DNA damage endonuclease